MSLIRSQFIRNLLFVSSSQIVILIIGILRMILLPILFSVKDFGYWSIYIFYSGYIGLFCLGYNDGVYLKYGGCDYHELPHKRIRSASVIFLAMLSIFTILTILFISVCIDDISERFAMQIAACNIFVLGINGFLIQVLQITNQMKKYSFFSILDKAAVIITIISMFVIGKDSWRVLIYVDFSLKVIIVIAMIIHTKELWIGPLLTFSDSWQEFKDNISVGLKLMFAGICGMLLVGAGRMFIQFMYDIDTYSIYSFSISITNIVLTCVTAFSLVLYPTIKRLQPHKYQQVFLYTNKCIRVILLMSLILYFPACYVIENFYSNYIAVLRYLNVMFVIIALQVKISVLNNTFYKVLRQEKEMLKANLYTVILFAILILISHNLHKEIIVIPICTLIAFAIRCYFSEYYLSKFLETNFSKMSYLEIILLTVFLLVTSYFGQSGVSIAIMIISLLLLLFVHKSDILLLKSYFIR